MPPQDYIGFVYDTDIMKHRAGALYRWSLLPSNAVFFDIVAEDSGRVLDSGTVLVMSAADAAYELDCSDSSWSYEDFVILMSKARTESPEARIRLLSVMRPFREAPRDRYPVTFLAHLARAVDRKMRLKATFYWSDAALDEVEAAAKADANFLGGERSVTHINTIRC